jgi:LysM repeat protein
VANNHFCIKCKSSWTGRTITHADDRPDDCFRVYDSVEESFQDHAEFLNEGQRYEFLFAYDTDDYKSWAKGLKKAGYATAPDYAERLISVIERYHLYLLDGKNGIEAYDKYVAETFAAEEIKIAPTQDEATTAEEGTSAEAESVVDRNVARDATLAYADRGIDPNNFRVTINSHHGYNVYLTNEAHYIIAKSGDTFAQLSEIFHVAPQTLRKFNDLKTGAEPKEGDVVYIERKLSRWSGSDMIHTVSEGETLHFLSQLYGIRLHQLSKLNRLREDDTLVVGRTLRLR